ncbi:MAG: DUF2939 domain-containing protein [Acidobacteriota bacterium]
MRKIGCGAVILLILGAVLAYASPYRTIKGIKEAVDADDPDRLSAYIDYPALRANLKDQFHTGVTRYLDRKESSPFAALGAALAGGLGDRLVDTYVTPDGVAALLKGDSPVDDGPGKENAGHQPAAGSGGGKILRDPRLRFRSLSRVEVVATDRDDQDVSFVLTRTGLTWKLTNIILPLDPTP